LQVIHAIVPASRRRADPLFGSARYRKVILDSARKLFQEAGVPEGQVKNFMGTIGEEYPPTPTAEEIFLEQISNNSFLAIALCDRRQDLSYYQSGVPEFTTQDLQLLRECLKDWHLRIKGSPKDREQLLNAVFEQGLV
jgi:hypothetical protein